MFVIKALFFAVFALGGRWIQLHPERIVPKGQFATSRGARLFHAQVAILGTFMVFSGIAFAIPMLLAFLSSSSTVLHVLTGLVGAAAGVFAALYVRKEVRKQPEYVSSNPYGWWP